MRMNRTLVLGLVGGLIVLGAQQAEAQDETLNKARAAFDRAQELYEKGDFATAATEFEAAFAARSFPQFLFNIGASHEKLRDYAKAVTYYERYIAAVQDATEKAATAKRIEVLKREIARLAAKPPDAPPEVTPSEEVQKLDEAKIRGGIVIESQPQGALVFLDNKDGKPIGRTPLNTQLEGEHRIFLVKEGYKPFDQVVATASDKLVVLVAAMAEEDYLGFVEITSNVPKSDIFVDDRNDVYQQTPWKGNLPPGKHKVWVTKEGYNTYEVEVNVIAGSTQQVSATLKGGPVGYINVRGPETDRNKIYVDGELLCERGPCRRPIREGSHKVSVRRGGHKTYERSVNVQPETEMTVYAKLAEKPGRGDAIIAYIMTAALVGGGIYAIDRASGIRDDLKMEVGNPGGGVSNQDSRFNEARLWAAGGHGLLGLGAISGALALYYTFRDKGAPSTGTVDVKAITVAPAVGPSYAGVGVGGAF